MSASGLHKILVFFLLGFGRLFELRVVTFFLHVSEGRTDLFTVVMDNVGILGNSEFSVNFWRVYG